MTNEQNIIAVPVPVDVNIFKYYSFFDKPCEFLGCVSFKDGEYIFDFDIIDLVDVRNTGNGFQVRDYKYPEDQLYGWSWILTPEQSFITRLQSMGHYWVNPVPYNPYSEAWIEAESKCLRPDQKLAVMKIGG